eukprot:gnl/TRDRNA2_/TRDRNA2_37556_c0_seq1.p1 gnl/TRDRNA2_/TRDRNA2_37556_c0~~gnl/TRDRNA2_/TRDRNA2_37556_c0_seq1.p1  ORF type:complete len:868 (-),score=131.20 gnl/TRDRNA2_/TRDRNA2_37556_c0_seq1:40-2643(-)
MLQLIFSFPFAASAAIFPGAGAAAYHQAQVAVRQRLALDDHERRDDLTMPRILADSEQDSALMLVQTAAVNEASERITDLIFPSTHTVDAQQEAAEAAKQAAREEELKADNLLMALLPLLREKQAKDRLQAERSAAQTAALGEHPEPERKGKIHDGRDVQDTQHDKPMQLLLATRVTEAPSGSDIWNSSSTWATVEDMHPAAVTSHLYGKVVWADVSFLSLKCLLLLSMVAYPMVVVAIAMVCVVLVSIVLVQKEHEHESDSDSVSSTSASSGDGSNSRNSRASASCTLNKYMLPVLPKDRLTASSHFIYTAWALFCCTIPSIMVFGIPLVLCFLSWPYPQEVYAILTLVTSAFVFSNGIYMVAFASGVMIRMKSAMQTDYLALLRWRDGRNDDGLLQRDVVHWVVIPNYKEDREVLSMTLSSIARSGIAKKQICVLLAMEARETGGSEKAAHLLQEFSGCFLEMTTSYHPANLPNDPPGKASNMSWAFNRLVDYLEVAGKAKQKTLLTVADADSEFDDRYFEGLTLHYLETSAKERDLCLWQTPIFHIKNYHRQPAPVVVGSMFTTMQELAVLGDPNAIRFPYSTYSLSMELARIVGGWDPEWIAEDWHMGIKCFLLTLGRATVQPILLPTLNFTPEDETWWSTVQARWCQAKRHALGFSDLTYFFMTLPLIFGYVVSKRRVNKDGRRPNLRDFWNMFFQGLALIVRLVNVHVIIGCMTSFAIISVILRWCMWFVMAPDRRVAMLFDRTNFCSLTLMACSSLMMVMVTILFMNVYKTMRPRLEPEKNPSFVFRHTFIHWLYTLLSFVVFGMFYFWALGLAVWKAAWSVLFSRTFEYEVAAKPTSHTRAKGGGVNPKLSMPSDKLAV